jgi:glycosyltransferase involved in cell wall biosynthesis
MKVIHLNYSDIIGGAARGAYRVHLSLRKSGVDSRMWVNQSVSGDFTVEIPLNKFQRTVAKVYSYLVKLFIKILKTENLTLHSPQIFSSRWVKKINNCDADIIHLHWTQNEMLSISDISSIKKPIIWTLYDMWAFCGAEHYTSEFRWKYGYQNRNRPAYESGFDLNLWTWKRKINNWKKPINIITPSHWLGNCIKESKLMNNWPIQVIPLPIDTDFWKPLKKNLAREALDLPKELPIVLFGAVGGGQDPRKGFDLLLDSLKFLSDNQYTKNIQLVVFGQTKPKILPNLNFSIHYIGHLYDDITLRTLYSAADVMIVPSRLEAFGQTASEAQACGTPVVAFDNGGLKDIILHLQTGYLANSFDTQDLANGIIWSLEQCKNNTINIQSRNEAIRRFSYEIVAEQYKKIYERLLFNRLS